MIDREQRWQQRPSGTGCQRRFDDLGASVEAFLFLVVATTGSSEDDGEAGCFEDDATAFVWIDATTLGGGL
jgi:hypothetical protein